jgi:tetratricopeptide (TPR) repeat protein
MDETLEYIDNYFKGELPSPQAVQFERRILEDPAFAGEVAFYLSYVQTARDQLVEDKKTRFREIYQLTAPERARYAGQRAVPIKKLWPWLSVAAAIIGIIAAWWLFMKPLNPQQLADQYVREKWAHPGLTMSATTDSMQAALRLYSENKFQEARIAFEKMAGSDSTNNYAKRYAGIVSFRLKDYDKAMFWFGQLEKDKELYANPAKFYQAITLMERSRPGDIQQAHELLRQIVEKDLEGKEYAQKWVKEF